MAYTTLISTAALSLRLDDPELVVVDCRYALGSPDWGEDAWAAGHIRGAVYADLERDLSGPKTGKNGRHPLPDVAALARTFGRFGISGGSQVVAYDQDTGMFASRLWWLLRWLGHDEVAVLDGGFAKWGAEHRPFSVESDRPAATNFQPMVRPHMVATLSAVADRHADPNWRLIDARAPERYSGETEPLDKVAGHIPGATNYFFQGNLNENGTFRKPEQLRQQLQAALGSAQPDHAICYCGSGVTACHNLLALEHAGISGVRLYPGSWSEWSSDPARPTETKDRA